MVQIKSVSIPQRCHQQWQQMMKVDKGRHCESCCKTVTDFTTMTNQEIISTLGSAPNVCGRFNADQLTRLNESLNPPKTGNKLWKRMGLAAFIALLFSTVKTEAQVKKSTLTHSARLIKAGKIDQRYLVKPDSLYCKTLTPAQINIDIKNKCNDAMEMKIPERPFVISTVLGGVSVQGISVNDSSNTFYISLRELFKY
jgi:hypothetical protein